MSRIVVDVEWDVPEGEIRPRTKQLINTDSFPNPNMLVQEYLESLYEVKVKSWKVVRTVDEEEPQYNTYQYPVTSLDMDDVQNLVTAVNESNLDFNTKVVLRVGLGEWQKALLTTEKLLVVIP